MSTNTEHVEDETDSSVLETWSEWYHVPVLGAVILFMIWVRTQAYGEFITEDGTPALAGVDSWYHWRTIQWTSENFPNTMPFDVWTGFPTGRYVGQFGTLFDQLIVTVAMIVGLGDPSPETLYTVSLLAVPVMAGLIAIPVFYIGRRLGGTLGGITSIVLLALIPGQFLSRSTVGQLDHHIGEVLFMAIAILALMAALRSAEREQPIYELLVDGDWETLRQPTIYSVLAGIALSLYIWVWPSGVVLVGILAIFFTIQLCLDYVRNISPDHVAFVGAVSLGLTAIITALLIEQFSTSATSFGLLQPLSAALVAGGCLFMAWFARQWNSTDIDRRYYPAAIGALIALTFAVMWLALPNLFDNIVSNAARRAIPFGGTATDLTIQEAQPPDNFTQFVGDEFGAAFYTMLVGLGLLIARPFLGRKFRAEYTLIVVWSLFLISMAATQIRFSYYLTLAVVVVNAVFVADIARLFNFDVRGSIDSLRQVETYQVIVLVMIVLLLFAPLLPPMAQGSTAWQQAEGVQPHGDAQTWESSNEWLAENTPAPGNWGGADNASELDYYGSYSPGDGDYDYPVGSYGVLSWWDYGHLITTQAERIPHSNPFQQNAESSAAFLTAESETRGELVLDAIAAGASVSNQSNEELEQIVADADETNEEIRYIMIDDGMAAGKFSAISAWSGPDYSHYITPDDLGANEQIDRDEVSERFGDLPYDDTMTSSLYFNNAVGMDHYRLVHEDADDQSAFISYAIINTNTDQVLMSDDGTPQVRINQQLNSRQTQVELSVIQQRPNLEYELIGQRQTASVKTYERVEGATLTGTVGADAVEAGDVVTATLELETNTGTTFNYTQRGTVDESGSFELTVPYATNDELGVDDGYTNSDVEALDENYTLSLVTSDGNETSAYEATTAVPETAVIDGDTITTEFEEVEFDDGADGNETDAGNESDAGTGNETGEEGDSTDDESTGDGSSDNDTETTAAVSAKTAP
ncbi:oligosaccharyl transferase, archaeosortase A system-associated [Natrialba aegyptia]|uniref:dolichyl-phosphooligosaccharide-protein glycotransferase n=1 Tax=Natrialba aegyptia DSM 13077 TaxID=1227491 RepID=M0B207_9EURY|nr:oligosaccharyl transferase, archaeosortase A system-associated [Natrialba aegyptia]ELZ04562.1 Oligosaccharyl transferase STT3 subunit [Natrialba aegyptia DSM 13077]